MNLADQTSTLCPLKTECGELLGFPVDLVETKIEIRLTKWTVLNFYFETEVFKSSFQYMNSAYECISLSYDK